MRLIAPETVTFTQSGFCPGCGHGLAVRLIAEVMEEMELSEKLLAVVDVACGSLNIDSWRFDTIMAAHGRPVATAIGAKKVRPENPVMAYIGDGAAYSIGMAETVHAAARNENITVIFVNNAIYGMTGGQMAPTSLPGQVTQTSPYGRDVNHCGWPIKVCEMLATLEGPEYVARVAVNNVKNVKAAGKAIQKAFQNQIDKKGFSLIEVVSACPTNWGMTPQKALEWVESDMLPYYPLGVYKDRSAAKEAEEK